MATEIPQSALTRGPFSLLPQSVADLKHRLNLFICPAELFAQAGDVGVYGAQALGVGQLAPDALKNHITIERRAPVAHQQFQQVKLPPPQVQWLAVLPGHPVHRIQHDIIGPQLPPAAAGAAQHRATSSSAAKGLGV